MLTGRERKIDQRISTRPFRRHYRGLLTLAVLITLIPQPGVLANAATLRVTTASDDSSPGSLRSVIASALPGDTIKFKQDLAGQTITLQPDLPLTIDKNLTIEGLGARRLTIAATHTNFLASSAVFDIVNGAVVAISGLRISGGRPGINIGEKSTLNLSRSIVAGNSSQLPIGGIVNVGTLTVDNTTISDNTAGDLGAGGIRNLGTLFIHSSTISNNSSLGLGLV